MDYEKMAHLGHITREEADAKMAEWMQLLDESTYEDGQPCYCADCTNK